MSSKNAVLKSLLQSPLRVVNVGLQMFAEDIRRQNIEVVEVIPLVQPRSIINAAVSVPMLDLFTGKRVVYEQNTPDMPPWKLIEKSPLRFTWEYLSPPYYEDTDNDAGLSKAVVIIMAGQDQAIPSSVREKLANYRLAKELVTTDRVFRYQTLVRIYLPVQEV